MPGDVWPTGLYVAADARALWVLQLVANGCYTVSTGRVTFVDGRAWHPRGRAAPGADRGLLARPEVTDGPAAACTAALPWWCEHFNPC
jgi:hypothetical protein